MTVLATLFQIHGKNRSFERFLGLNCIMFFALKGGGKVALFKGKIKIYVLS